jgi:probable rRNA maturation factor
MLDWLRGASELDGPAELSIALVDDATIRGLNRDYRDKDRTTDVLAFSMREGEVLASRIDGPPLLGDVIISVPTASRQARKNKKPLREELTMLLAHGLLHLLGYDHQTDKQEVEMGALTRQLEIAAGQRR